MTRFWQPKAPNMNSVVELVKKDGRKFIGYYRGVSKENGTIFLDQTNRPLDDYLLEELSIQVKKDGCIQGNVLRW